MAYTNSILGQAEREFDIHNSNPTKGNSELGKDAFLQLLVVQMQNQDPLNPMEDKEFVAELAQFSQLENLQNIESGISNMNEASTRNEMTNAVGFIGKEVRAQGSTVTKSGDSVSTLYFDLEDPIGGGFVNIFDKNGEMVHTMKLNQMQAGEYSVTWDGKDYYGKVMPDGQYKIAMAAEGLDGSPVLVSTDVSGKVTGVVSDSEGGFVLKLEDGRAVDFQNIKEVTDTQTASTNDDNEENTSS